MIVDRLDVSYWEGWDPQARAAVGPLSASLAAERDRAGAQYAVLLSVTGQPLAIIEVAWREFFCAVRFFDTERRRALELDFRRLEQDRIALTGGRQWEYRDAMVPEYAEFDGQSVQYVFQWPPGGQPNGYTVGGRPRQQLALRDQWLAAPQLGDWGRFVAEGLGFALAAMGHQMRPDVTVANVSEPSGAGLPDGERPWHPPRPLAPSYLDELFTPETRFAPDPKELLSNEAGPVSVEAGPVTVEVWPAGMLRMPSGRLTACDPTWGDLERLASFTVTVPPGEYPVSLSVVRFSERILVAAAKLAVRDAPVASWEMALTAGQDLRILGDGEFFGFGVDAGTACFLDASAAEPLSQFSSAFELEGMHTELTDPQSGANWIAYQSGLGDGAYPTWIGRDHDGEVVCFVSDMLVLGTRRPQPDGWSGSGPQVSGEPVTLAEPPVSEPDSSLPPSPGPLGEQAPSADFWPDYLRKQHRDLREHYPGFQVRRPVNDLAGLRELIGDPPAGVPTVNWAAVHARLGFTLPADYRQFIDAYGPGTLGAGTVGDDMQIMAPGAPGEMDLFALLDRVYAEVRALPRYPWQQPYYPEPGGTVCWGKRDGAREFLGWAPVSADPDEWEAVRVTPGQGYGTANGVSFSTVLRQYAAREFGLPLEPRGPSKRPRTFTPYRPA